MKIKCHSVKLKELTKISDKCYKAISYDGSECLLPVSQVYGMDLSVKKSEAYWVSAWILAQKKIQWSPRKTAWFNTETGEIRPHIEVIKHTPEKILPQQTKPNNDLVR